MIFFWTKVYGLEGKTPYIYPRYQVWGVTDLGFNFWRSPLDYHPPLFIQEEAFRHTWPDHFTSCLKLGTWV